VRNPKDIQRPSSTYGSTHLTGDGRPKKTHHESQSPACLAWVLTLARLDHHRLGITMRVPEQRHAFSDADLH